MTRSLYDARGRLREEAVLEEVQGWIAYYEHKEKPLSVVETGKYNRLLDEAKRLERIIHGPRIDPEVDPIHYV